MASVSQPGTDTAAGRIAHSVYEKDDDADGLADSRIKVSRLHDFHGNVIWEEAFVDMNADGADDSRSTSTTEYEEQGRRMFQESKLEDLITGVVSRRSTFSYAKDVHGRTTFSESVFDSDGDGPGASDRITSRYTWATGTIPILDEQEVDRANDGIIDYRRRFILTLERHRTDQVVEVDSNGDGALESREQTVSLLDSRGHVVEELWKRDMDGDGIDDLSSRSIYQRDAHGDTVFVEGEFGSGDGTVSSRSTTTISRDHRGNVVRRVWEADEGADGSVEFRETMAAVYDQHGRVVSSSTNYQNPDWELTDVTRASYEGDVEEVVRETIEEGIVIWRFTLREERDVRGNVLNRSYGNSVPEGSGWTVETAQYDATNRPLWTMREYDADSDGMIETRERTTFTYEGSGGPRRQ